VGRSRVRFPMVFINLMFVDLYIIVQFIQKNPTRCNSVSKFCYSIFIWSSTCFGRHTAHHQELKTAIAASGFAYVGSCWTCGCWTLSGRAWQPDSIDALCVEYLQLISDVRGPDSVQFVPEHNFGCFSGTAEATHFWQEIVGDSVNDRLLLSRLTEAWV